MFLQSQNSSSSDEDESRLWQDLLNGNKEALNSLFRMYYGGLLNYGTKLVADRELVKDAIQKLFLKLWNKRQSLSKPQSVKSYLYVSLRRIVLARVKKRKARDERNQSYMDSVFRQSSNIEEAIIRGESQTYKKKRLAEAIPELSPRQKEALYLRFYDGLTNKEIALVMDIAHQSVRNHISKALGKIRQHMPDSFSFPQI